MKFTIFAAGLCLAAAAASPATAQTLPQDVRCLMLSNLFGQASTDQRAREAAQKSLLYYVGRVEGRADTQTITNTMRAQAATVDPATSGTEMAACNARLARAMQAVQAMGRAAAPPAPKK